MEPTVKVTSNITTQNSTPTADKGTSGSTVSLLDIGHLGTVTIQVSGTYTGALTIQARLDETSSWVTLGGVPILNINTGALSATIPTGAQGMWQVDVSAFQDIRVTALAAVTGTARVTLRATEGQSMMALRAALPTGANVIGGVTVGAAATSVGKAEDAAHASADVGIPAFGVRYETLTAPAAANDYMFSQVDDLGKNVNMPYAPPVNQLQGITAAMAATADVAVIAAQGAGVRIYVTGLVITNTHATVGTEVVIKDGSTIIDRIYVPALKTEIVNYPTPKKLTANTALNAANITTGSNTYVSAVGFKAL